MHHHVVETHRSSVLEDHAHEIAPDARVTRGRLHVDALEDSATSHERPRTRDAIDDAQPRAANRATFRSRHVAHVGALVSVKPLTRVFFELLGGHSGFVALLGPPVIAQRDHVSEVPVIGS